MIITDFFSEKNCSEGESCKLFSMLIITLTMIMFSTWPWLCMVQWGLAVTWEMPWSHTRADTIGFFTICSFLKHGQMGLWSEQHSFEGSGIRQQLTIWCQSGGTIPRQECFCSVYSMDNFLSDSPIHQLCSLLPLLLHSRSLLVKSAPTCLLF